MSNEISVADAFVTVFDAWEASWSIEKLELWITAEDVRARIEAARIDIETEGVSQTLLGEALEHPLEGLVLTSACDLALAACHPGMRSSMPVPGPLIRTDAQFRATGRLNETTDGALLVRWVRPGRPGAPDAVSDIFGVVTRVPQSEWRKVRHVVVPLVNELPVTHHLPEGEPQIGCLPFAADVSDFEVPTREVSGKWRYRLQPSATLKDRPLQSALAALDGSGVTLALLPEGVLDGDLLNVWRHAASRSVSKGRLRWIVVGSGPGVKACGNAAVLIDRDSGEVIASQGKRSRFNLRVGDIQAWQLPLDPAPHSEDIEPDKELCVIESAAGRFVLFICEDVTRVKDGSLLIAVGPSHILVPIFSTEIGANRWEAENAKQWATNVGSIVVISNSLAVIRARSAAGCLEGEPNTAVIVRPGEDDYSGPPELFGSTAWNEPAVFGL